MHEPTALYHSTEDALRVLESVARHTAGADGAAPAREAGVDPARLTALLRMLRREGYVEQTADGTWITGDTRRDHLSRHRMARLTSRTITSDKVLLSRLESQPPTVPVPALQEYAVGTVCAAVPITAGASVGCLAVSLPVERAHRLRRAADVLNRHAAPVLLSPAL